MRFITCRLPDGVEDPAILSEDGRQVWPLSWLGLSYETLSEAIPFLTPQVRYGLSLAIAGIPALPVEAVTLESPIPAPAQDVICLGINYMAHSDEAEKYSAAAFATKHEDAIYFSKRVTRAVPDGGPIEAHTDLVKKLDYECELAVVLGRDARDVPAGQTRDYIFGYTILNDVSARDVQTAHKQWYFGKSLDGFTPIGPCIVTADAFADYPPRLGIRSFVNGEKRQDSNTALQIFDIDHVIAELSQGMTLKAGTIIATGTPAGVGMGMDPPQFLKPGDVVRCEIDGIGTLTNPVKRFQNAISKCKYPSSYIIDDKIALVHILFKISSFEVHTLPVYIGQQRRTPRRIPCAVTARQAAKDACCVRGKELERYENWFYRADPGGHRGLRGHRPR